MQQFVYLVVRWVARLSAVLVAGGFLFLVAGEMLSPHSGPPTHLREFAGIGLLAFAMAGMLLAWKWELPGALLSLGALATFVAVVRLNRYGVIAVIAIPGVLFLADWILRAGSRSIPVGIK
jgi:hypothetical protein